MKTKTVKQWLETLPKELRKEAISQTSKTNLNTNCKSLSWAIVCMINWCDTKEGADFWQGLEFNLCWAEQLDSPPKKLKSVFNP